MLEADLIRISLKPIRPRVQRVQGEGLSVQLGGHA